MIKKGSESLLCLSVSQLGAQLPPFDTQGCGQATVRRLMHIVLCRVDGLRCVCALLENYCLCGTVLSI